MNINPEPTQTAEAKEMARFGITRVPTDRFHYKEYRYSLLSDAIAQAKRDSQRLE